MAESAHVVDSVDPDFDLTQPLELEGREAEAVH